MDVSTPTVSPLRQRMLEDMRMRKFEPKTQSAYLRAVRKLAKFLGRSPDSASAEDLRRFQMDLVDSGASPITLNTTISGLKFFFDITLSRGELSRRLRGIHGDPNENLGERPHRKILTRRSRPTAAADRQQEQSFVLGDLLVRQCLIRCHRGHLRPSQRRQRGAQPVTRVFRICC
jgi:hypothetical protein